MASSSAYNFSKKILSPTSDHHRHPEIDKIDEKQVSRNQVGDSGLVQREMVSRDRDSKQLNDKIYSSKARLPSALAGFGRKGGSRRVKGREEGKGWLEETSAVHRRSLVQDFYPAELRRNLWMPFPYPQDTNSTLPTRLLSFYRSYIPRRNGCPRSISTSTSTDRCGRFFAWG